MSTICRFSPKFNSFSSTFYRLSFQEYIESDKLFLWIYTRREGIANDTLEDVERAFVHPNLVASVEGNDDIDVSDGIGN